MKLFTTDKELTIVHKLSRGEATAIDLLYAEYAPFLTAVCARYIPQNDDMKDVLQEAFIKMFNKGNTKRIAESLGNAHCYQRGTAFSASTGKGRCDDNRQGSA